MTIKQVFDKQGFYGPVKFLSESENNYYKKQLLDSDTNLNLMFSDYRCKSNVLFPWVSELSKNKIIIDHVKQILGDNFHCWDTLIWIKEAQSDKYVSWHQDATYWNFAPKESGITVWVTLSGADHNMGCLKYLPGSHKLKQLYHSDIKNYNNLLMRGQTVNYNVENSINAECEPGSFLLHSPYIVHGSEKNNSNIPRLALGFIYVATFAKPLESYDVESTIMILGSDEYNYMVHDPEPTGNWAVDLQSWKLAYDRQHANYYKMTQSING